MRKLLIALILFGGVMWLVTNNSKTTEEQPPAQDQQQTEQQAQEEQKSETMGTATDEAVTESHKAGDYAYTAQRGDSYTEMARKAVQTYAKQHNMDVSKAGVIFAETNLTKLAGSPRLEVGQQIEFNEQTVKEWTEKAQALTAAQQSAWNKYVSSVNFNTDTVGVAQ